MENHNTGTINSSARYCLVKPGDKVRITKTHRAGIRQYAACEGDTFVITKLDGTIVSNGASYKKLRILEVATNYITEKKVNGQFLP